MRYVLAVAITAMLAAACSGAPSSSGPPVAGSPTAPTTSGAVPSTPAQPAQLTEYKSSVGRDPASTSTDATMQQVVAADTSFAFSLYHELADSSQSDVFLSPYSISTALSMVLAGARTETAAQIERVLGSSKITGWDQARNLLSIKLVEQLPTGIQGQAQPMTLETANAIFGQTGYPFEQPFLDLLARDYGAGLEGVDFATQPDAARQAINGWVDQQTADRIPNLLSPGSIDQFVRAVLVNTIYFKANWINPFPANATTNEPFHRIDGTVLNVPMMHAGEFEMDYASGTGWSSVDLPYYGADMLLIVPDAGHFAQVEKSVDPTFLADLNSALANAYVTLSLPKWSTDDTTDLIPPLKSLGITDLFDPNGASDLSGVTTAEQLFISDATHDANITVDEQGTEAAAATALVAYPTARNSGMKTVTLTVDRPFIYLIRDQNTKELLFMGQALDPGKS